MSDPKDAHRLMSTGHRRAVLFDATGTLIDLREPVGETYARFAAERGVQISPWRLGDAFARVIAKAPALVFPDVPREARAQRERDAWHEIVRQTFQAADSASAPRALASFDALFAWYGGGGAWRVREGAREALSALQAAHFRCAVVSNFDQRLHGILADLDLAAHFDLVWLPAEAGLAKPDPDFFRGALRLLDVPPKRATVVGNDEERDLAAARAAGLRAVDVRTLATLAVLPARIQRGIPEEAT